MKYGKKQTQNAMRGGRLLMVTLSASDGPSYALDNGVGIAAKLGRELTKPLTSGPMSQDDLFIIPNNDGLFPGMSQTWRSIN